jgi:flagellar basal body-associated protein FliL
MAKEEKENKKQDDTQQSGIGIIRMLLIAFVLLASIIGGFFTGRLMGSDETEDPNKQQISEKDPNTEKIEQKKEAEKAEDGDNWYYELDPVLANLNVPGATRYVRAVLVLEMSPEISKSKGEQLMEKKKPVLINWLTIYLSSLDLNDVKGEDNLKRIQAMVLDVFNEKLWPDSKPKIEKVLIKEFPIQ